MGMTLAQMLTAMRLDLKDSGSLWSDTELTRCITRAVADFSRFLPLEKVYEKTIVVTVTGEHWTAAAAAGTYVTLANKPIKKGSEAVTDSAGTACVRDTDYTIDYSNGKITHISGGKISNGEVDNHITYTKSKIAVDLSSLTDLIKVDSVEYPLGDVPQSLVSFGLWASILEIEGKEESSQDELLSVGDHLVVKYSAEHTVPATAAGSFPSFLDGTVVLASNAYALFMMATKHEHQAITDLAAMRTVLTAAANIIALHTLIKDGTTGQLTLVTNTLSTATSSLSSALIAAAAAEAAAALGTTALNSVSTYLITGTTSALGKLALNIAGMYTKVNTALDAAATELGKVWVATTGDFALAGLVWTDEAKHILTTATIPNAEDFLELGDDLINISNKGQNVAENYRQYSETTLAMAALWDSKRKDFLTQAGHRINSAIGYVQEAANRITQIRGYIEEANGYMSVANGFIAEGSQRAALAIAYNGAANAYVAAATARIQLARTYIDNATAALGEIDRYLTEAQLYRAAVGDDLAIAEKFRIEAVDRRNEAWSIWRDPKQFIGDFSLVSLRQPAAQAE